MLIVNVSVFVVYANVIGMFSESFVRIGRLSMDGVNIISKFISNIHVSLVCGGVAHHHHLSRARTRALANYNNK